MRKITATMILALLASSPAEAAHCRKGQLYRVSMHRCVPAGSKLGREIRGHYARLEADEPRHKRGRRVSRRTRFIVDKPQEEKPDWFVEILIPNDGSLDNQTPRDEPQQTETPKLNPLWPPNWADWYSPRHLTGP